MIGTTEIIQLAGGNLMVIWDSSNNFDGSPGGDVIGCLVNFTTGAVFDLPFAISAFGTDTIPQACALADRAWRGQSRLYVYSDRDGKNE
jgi:hypothetical protein